MTARWLVGGLLIGGCSPDPIVGSWSQDSKVIEFHDDGRLTGAAWDFPECRGETAAVAACAPKSHWERSGSTYHITLMGLTPHPTVGFGGMFAPPPRHGNDLCDCVVMLAITAEVHGDELVYEDAKGTAHRVKP
jgi:hypothetical protein